MKKAAPAGAAFLFACVLHSSFFHLVCWKQGEKFLKQRDKRRFCVDMNM
jgi:hypothetical protein